MSLGEHWTKKKMVIPLLLILLLMFATLSACTNADTSGLHVSKETNQESKQNPVAFEVNATEEKTENTQVANDNLKLYVDGEFIPVKWENNESVEKLKMLVKELPLTIKMSMYGGFEQVGAIGVELPRKDSQTTTSPGDIVLYSGNQIVLFYGSNSWSYTRLGKITGKTDQELAKMLGSGDVVVRLEVND